MRALFWMLFAVSLAGCRGTANLSFSDEIRCASGQGTFRSTRRMATIELTRQ
jgi:hypothetical protein